MKYDWYYRLSCCLCNIYGVHFEVIVMQNEPCPELSSQSSRLSLLRDAIAYPILQFGAACIIRIFSPRPTHTMVLVESSRACLRSKNAARLTVNVFLGTRLLQNEYSEMAKVVI